MELIYNAYDVESLGLDEIVRQLRVVGLNDEADQMIQMYSEEIGQPGFYGGRTDVNTGDEIDCGA